MVVVLGIVIVTAVVVLVVLGVRHAPKLLAIAAAVAATVAVGYLLWQRNRKITAIAKPNEDAAAAYRDLAVTTARQRRLRLAEDRRARAAIEEVRREFDRKVADRDQHVADLWNRAFGRESRGEPAGGRSEDGSARDASGADGGGGGTSEDEEDPPADVSTGPSPSRGGIDRRYPRPRSLASYRRRAN